MNDPAGQAIRLNQSKKALVRGFWNALGEMSGSPAETHLPSVQGWLHPDVKWRGCEPLGSLNSAELFLDQFWHPLNQSLTGLRRDCHIFMGGKSSGRRAAPVEHPLDDPSDNHWWVAGTGYFHAVFHRDYLGIPAHGGEVRLRWGEFCRVEFDRIVEINLMLDLPDLALQAGHRLLPPSRGAEGLYPAPARNDGILSEAQDYEESRYSLDHIRRFIFDGLEAFDRDDLQSMGMANWFHPALKWYGPEGIGACLSFTEFETLHQARWLHAFPNRSSGDLHALIGEGHYTAVTAFDGMTATHLGEYLGYPASGKNLRISGLDFWKREGDQLVENWVFVDMIGLFQQIGVDLLSNIRR